MSDERCMCDSCMAPERLAQAQKALVIARDLARDNLAKADAAEKELQRMGDTVVRYEALTEEKTAELIDLRARIKALADEWERQKDIQGADQLRALLQPPKAETALDVLERGSALLDNGDWHISAVSMAKLRALLEKPTAG